jgi:hypothetical protein
MQLHFFDYHSQIGTVNGIVYSLWIMFARCHTITVFSEIVQRSTIVSILTQTGLIFKHFLLFKHGLLCFQLPYQLQHILRSSVVKQSYRHNAAIGALTSGTIPVSSLSLSIQSLTSGIAYQLPSGQTWFCPGDMAHVQRTCGYHHHLQHLMSQIFPNA